MALPTLTLDDRSFDQLFDFMRRQIDTGAWSDHNYSDGGIALLDLVCWIGEMILYRADRVPPSHLEKFASLILDPPEPVTVPLILTATHGTEVSVPAGSRFATDFVPATATRPARRFVFETIAPLRFRPLATPAPWTQTLSVTARELLAIEDEELGQTSSPPAPHQTFPLRPVRLYLGLPPDAPAPALTDFVFRSASYEPNPQVEVGGTKWELRRFLLTEDSKVGPTPKNHYMVDPDGRIRFGDDTFGSIPPAAAKVVCTRYQVLQGPDALIAADSLKHWLDPVPGLTLTKIENGSAEGGDFFFRPEERIREGLKRFRRPYRLVTEADFERVLRVDFNELQVRARAPERVLRAVALMNARPSAPAQLAPGHVTVVVLTANPGVDVDAALTDPSLGAVQKQALVDLAPALVDAMQRFLDRRRLITTRVHVLPAHKLVHLSIAATVAIEPGRNKDEMEDAIRRALRAFLGVARGGFDGRGWPLGGSVYRSKLFRLLEGMPGVDHVEALSLSPSDPNGDVPLDPLALPAVSGLAITTIGA